MTSRTLLVIILFSFLLGGCTTIISNSPKEERGTVTLEKAIKIGKRELKRIGALLPDENLEIIADDENTGWQKVVSHQPSILQYERVKKMQLEKKKYWAIGYMPRKLVLGGGAWVFIDRSDGTIIGYILEK
jgi:hypothetical protein